MSDLKNRGLLSLRHHSKRPTGQLGMETLEKEKQEGGRERFILAESQQAVVNA